MHRTIVAALLAVCATAAIAQEKLFESVEVNVVNVDVFVTNRDGHPVTGLTKEDFEVEEDGQRQSITNFSEYRTATPESHESPTTSSVIEPPPRRFLLFIDNGSIEASTRKSVFSALRRFATQLRANDQAGLLVFDQSLHVVVPMTANRTMVTAALDAIAAAPSPNTAAAAFLHVRGECASDYAQAMAHRLPANVAYDLCTNEASVQMAAEVMRNRRLTDAMRIAVTMIGGLDGKKALIVTGTALPLRPGLELFEMAKQMFAGLTNARDMRGERFPSFNEERYEPQSRVFEEVARHASSYDVALYFVTPEQSTEGIAIGTAVATPSTGAADFLRMGNTQEANHLLAENTGGLAPRQRDVDAALTAVTQTLDSYYSLGYKPPKGPGHDARAIVVRTKNKAYTVTSRRTFTLKSAAAQMADRVVANIYVPQTTPEWPIEIRVEKPKKERGNFVYPIEVSIPSTLTLLPREDKLIAGFALYVTVGTEKGAMSTTFRQPEAFTIAKSEEAAFHARPIPFRTTLTVSPGRNFVSVGVLDMISNTAGFARKVIVTP